jgi:hypothetical protein
MKRYIFLFFLLAVVVPLIIPPSFCADPALLSLEAWEVVPLDTLISPDNWDLAVTVTGSMVFKSLEQGKHLPFMSHRKDRIGLSGIEDEIRLLKEAEDKLSQETLATRENVLALLQKKV